MGAHYFSTSALMGALWYSPSSHYFNTSALMGALVLAILGDVLEPSWGRLGPSLEPLGLSWAVLGPFWAVYGASWAVLGRLGTVLGAAWAVLGRSSASWVVLGTLLDSPEAGLGPSWSPPDALVANCPSLHQFHTSPRGKTSTNNPTSQLTNQPTNQPHDDIEAPCFPP